MVCSLRLRVRAAGVYLSDPHPPTAVGRATMSRRLIEAVRRSAPRRLDAAGVRSPTNKGGFPKQTADTSQCRRGCVLYVGLYDSHLTYPQNRGKLGIVQSEQKEG